jgi:hypothetical protein
MNNAALLSACGTMRKQEECEKTVYINIDTSFCKFSFVHICTHTHSGFYVSQFTLRVDSKGLKSNGIKFSCIKFQAFLGCVTKRRESLNSSCKKGLCLCMSISICICVMSNGFCTGKIVEITSRLWGP